MTYITNREAGVVVSAQGSAKLRKEAPQLSIRSNIARILAKDLDKRSSLVTRTTRLTMSLLCDTINK